MRVPLSWLRELVAVELDVDDLVDVMSLHGLEVEAVHRPGAGLRGVRTARVLERRDHPDADELQVVRVTHGDDEVELVCGAWNFEIGDVVVHAEVGGRLPDGMELDARDIRGVTSHGMLCSAAELDLGVDHSGIIVLGDDSPVGAPLDEVLPVGEPVIEVAVFAQRGDHHSILGIAREVAAILDLDLDRPGGVPRPDADGPPVSIEAPGGCRQFRVWQLDEVTIGSSPWWMRRRLEACGIRAVSAVVDVTNYVMLELGQPLHAFDLDRLAGPELVARWATDGETLETLDGVSRSLRSTDMVVADGDGAVGLGGVMGGAATQVTDDTRRVVLEAATWDPATIRATSRRLGLVSEASLRFARRVDPAIAEPALARAAELLAATAGAAPTAACAVVEAAVDAPAVRLDPDWCAGFLGLDDLDADTQAAYLRREGCEVDRADGTLVVTPPSWRGDLGRPADLAEEIARLHGYEAIPATMPEVATAGGLTEPQRAEREVGRICRGFGLHEVQMRPFVGSDVLVGLAPSDGRVRPTNPLAEDAAALRPSLLEGLLEAVRNNVGQGRPGVALYELGRVFRPAGDPLDELLAALGDDWRWQDPDGRALPTQPVVLGLALQGRHHGRGWLDEDADWGAYDALAVLDHVVDAVLPDTDGSRPLARDQDVERDGLHPGRRAVLRLEGTEVGVAGQLHPAEADRRDLPEPVVVAELLVGPLLALAGTGRPVRAPALARHPAVSVDVALVADEQVPYARLEAAVREGAGDLLDELWWFDEYRGEQVGPGRRSLALRLRLQAADRQLSDADAEAVIDAVEAAAGAIGATLRR